ncbi:hypothetical protein ACQ4PT_022782 [Festuca glaucescens]
MAVERRRSGVAAAADAASWCCGLALVALLLVSSLGAGAGTGEGEEQGGVVVARGVGMHAASRRPCEEIYVVVEGETLHSISDRCGDPYILEHNPYVHDPDDVFPGLVIKITSRAAAENRN